jgi:hypothetical protein
MTHTESRRDHVIPTVVSSEVPAKAHAVEELLPSYSDRPLTALEARRMDTLEQRVSGITAKAAAAGVSIVYLGRSGLFDDARGYAGPETEWIFAPADRHDAYIPRIQARELEILEAIGLTFALIYIAHEVEKGVLPAHPHGGGPLVTIDRSEARSLVGPVPLPAASVKLDQRLNQRSQQVFTALTKAAKVGTAVAAAPFTLVGAAAGAIASGLDPIVIGAVPALGNRPGDPAIWWMLVKWEW